MNPATLLTIKLGGGPWALTMSSSGIRELRLRRPSATNEGRRRQVSARLGVWVEAEMLVDHLTFWQDVLGEQARFSFAQTAVRERIDDTVRPVLGVPIVEEPDRSKGSEYYAGTAIGIDCGDDELGDGGFTRWTADLCH